MRQPITMTLEEIKQDMNQYAHNFPIEYLPHISESEQIVDPIHNYRRPKPVEKPQDKKPLDPKSLIINDQEQKKECNALSHGVPTL